MISEHIRTKQSEVPQHPSPTKKREPSTLPSMENSARDYYAPFGMSPFDFNSMIRRRFLDDLVERLVEAGIVRRRSTGSGLARVEEQAEPTETPKTAETMTTVNNTAIPSVAAVAEYSMATRPASSVYSRDIDGNSYRSASTLQDFSSRSASFGSPLPPFMSLEHLGRSSGGSILESADADDHFSATKGVSDRNDDIDKKGAYSPSWLSAANLVPAPLSEPMPGRCGGRSVRSSADVRHHSPIVVERRSSCHRSSSTSCTNSTTDTSSPSAQASQGTSKGSGSRTYLSSPANSVLSSATGVNNNETHSDAASGEETPWPRRWLSSMKKSFQAAGSENPQDHAGKSCGKASQQPEDDFRVALLDLQQQLREQVRLPELHSDFEHMVELGKLRRKISSLDFDNIEIVLLASDMTICMQVPLLQVRIDKAHVDVDLIELAYQKRCQRYFRARL